MGISTFDWDGNVSPLRNSGSLDELEKFSWFRFFGFLKQFFEGQNGELWRIRNYIVTRKLFQKANKGVVAKRFA